MIESGGQWMWVINWDDKEIDVIGIDENWGVTMAGGNCGSVEDKIIVGEELMEMKD